MFKESTLAVASRVVMALGRAVLVILIANFLGPAAQGVFGISLSVVTIAALLSGAGLEVANAHFSGKYPARTRVLLVHAVGMSLALGLLAALGTFVVLVVFSSGYFRDIPVAYFWSVPVAVLGQVLQLFLAAIVMGRRDFSGYLVISGLCYGLVPLSVLGLALGGALSTASLMPLWAAGTWLGALASFWRAALLSRGQAIGWDWQLLREQLAFSKGAYLNNLANWLNYRLDLFLVAAFLDSAYVGYYSASSTIAEALLYVPKGLGAVAIAREAGLGTQSRVAALYKVTLLIMGVAAVGLFILAPWLIPLMMSAAFLPAVPSCRLLLPGVVFLSLAIIASNQLFGGGQSKIPSRGALLALSATVVLDLCLIPWLGIEGAALASTVAYGVYAAYLLRAVSSHTGYAVRRLIVPSRLDWEQLAKNAVLVMRRQKKAALDTRR